MNSKKKRIIILGVVLALVVLILGWLVFDRMVDRSGWKTVNGVTYYRDFHGRKVSGWLDLDGKRYFFGENKAMQTGWLNTESGAFYFDENGVMSTGWKKISGDTYCFDENGYMHTGWQENGSNVYYFGSDGKAAKGLVQIDGETYHFSPSGVMSIGWVTLDSETYYFTEDGKMVTGWQTLNEKKYLFGDDGVMTVGWLDSDGNRIYFAENGAMALGWTDIGEERFYFDESGNMYVGWLNLDGNDYYLNEDGTMAVGPTQIGERTHYFSPHGVHVLLVNPWNMIPEDYAVELTDLGSGRVLEKECAEAIQRMLADCSAEGFAPMIVSTNRTWGEQEFLYYRQVRAWQSYGYDYATACQKAGTIVAVPGTSEHQLGLAADIVSAYNVSLNESQENMPTQQWLMEHCWEYGFILRYPTDKTEITGIIYEPWHYRYVGVEISMEMRDLDMCLEEYLGAVNE